LPEAGAAALAAAARRAVSLAERGDRIRPARPGVGPRDRSAARNGVHPLARSERTDPYGLVLARGLGSRSDERRTSCLRCTLSAWA
jgi:hypothetical protein